MARFAPEFFSPDEEYPLENETGDGVVYGPNGNDFTGTLEVTIGGGSEITDASLEKLSDFLKTEKGIAAACPPGEIRASQSAIFTQDFEVGYALSDFDSLMFSIKKRMKDTDNDSLILASSDPDTVERLIRESPSSTDGVSFSVSPSPIISGIRVVIESPLMKLLESGTLYYCLKGMDPDTILSQGRLILEEAGIDTVTPLS